VKKLTPIWHARMLKQGEKIYARTMPITNEDGEHCEPHRNGCVLCEGNIAAMGMDTNWGSVVSLQYLCPIKKTTMRFHISDDETVLGDCFFVER